VTVREPANALFSHYVELYSQFSREKKSFLDLAMYDQRMEVFHYTKLFNEIMQSFDSRQIFVKKFEEIIFGKTEDLYALLTGEDVPCIPQTLEINNHKKEEDGHVLTGKDFALKDMVREILESSGVLENECFWPIKKILWPVLKSLDILKIRQMKVPKPTMEERNALREYLKNESQILRRLYGIEYV